MYRVIYAIPTIGKTYALSHGFTFIDWDKEFNKKRDSYLVEHGLTKSNMYKNPDFIKFMSKEWEQAKVKAKGENLPLLASPYILLELFPHDFNVFLTMDTDEFIKNNMARGGTYEDSIAWKLQIDSALKPFDYNKFISFGKHLTDYPFVYFIK